MIGGPLRYFLLDGQNLASAPAVRTPGLAVESAQRHKVNKTATAGWLFYY
jgi:hypothetical protein